MSKCSRCENTGKAGDDYCTCADGKMQKTLDRSRRTAERKKEAEKRKKDAAKKQKQEQIELF